MVWRASVGWRFCAECISLLWLNAISCLYFLSKLLVFQASSFIAVSGALNVPEMFLYAPEHKQKHWRSLCDLDHDWEGCCCADLEEYHKKGNCCAIVHSLTHSEDYLLLSSEKLITPVLVIYFYLLTSGQGLCVALWDENNPCLWKFFSIMQCMAKLFLILCTNIMFF